MKNIKEFDFSKPFRAKVLSTELMTPKEGDVEIRDIELEINEAGFNFESGQHIGVIAPAPEGFGYDKHFRLYSIAGSDKSRNSIQICVKRCFYIDEYNGERYKGAASNYLCDLQTGDEISITGPYGAAFRMPENSSSGILMLGLGTGIAPFRAFVKHLYGKVGSWQGPVRLFYGAKSGIELVYMNEKKNDFEQYYDESTFRAFQAISPKPYFDEPIALGDELEKNSEEIWKMLLNPDTHVYVAGIEKIREMLDKAFSKMAGSEENWERRLRELKAGGRWQEIIY